jgi:hypothetical protein
MVNCKKTLLPSTAVIIKKAWVILYTIDAQITHYVCEYPIDCFYEKYYRNFLI